MHREPEDGECSSWVFAVVVFVSLKPKSWVYCNVLFSPSSFNICFLCRQRAVAPVVCTSLQVTNSEWKWKIQPASGQTSGTSSNNFSCLTRFHTARGMTLCVVSGSEDYCRASGQAGWVLISSESNDVIWNSVGTSLLTLSANCYSPLMHFYFHDMAHTHAAPSSLWSTDTGARSLWARRSHLSLKLISRTWTHLSFWSVFSSRLLTV